MKKTKKVGTKKTQETAVEVYDTTLRDGSQGEGISYSVSDKTRITEKLDWLGVKYIEAGWPGSNPKDMEFFRIAKKMKLKNAQIVAFGSTRRANTKPSEDANLKALVSAGTDVITIFGKSWDMQVTDVLKTTLEENLNMIESSIVFLKKHAGEVIYDAEHFFDAYKANPEYAIKTLQAAERAGASTLVLCDTNGGTLPSQVFDIVSVVRRRVSKPLGIHTHNDCSMGVANAVAAVQAGARQVQGTINGIGERCGNPDLISIIPNLQLKLGFRLLPDENMKRLTDAARFIGEVGNMVLQDNQPYVGKSAFAHKGGVHINAVLKNPLSYEHIHPETVGNKRRFLTSELMGKTNITEKAKALGFHLSKTDSRIADILRTIQKLENEGYQFESAEASFELLIYKAMKKHRKFFDLTDFRVHVESDDKGSVSTEATIRLKVGDKEQHSVARGDGPVNALDNGLRKALIPFYPQLKHMHLSDYKVRVVNQKAGTAAKVRTFIESRDEHAVWTTVGVSENIIEASWIALVDSIEYKLLNDTLRSKR